MRIPLVCWLALALAGAVFAQTPAVQLAGVRSQKVLYGTKEPIAGTVTVKNAADVAVTPGSYA
ncbi:MAG TPA: hypothetical protein PK794_08265, partial [Armatimonadota bacterium]|nr:hypothetical protein [Armatimonadota bacterium]